MAEEKGSHSVKEQLKAPGEERVISHDDDDDDEVMDSLVPDGGWGWMVCLASFVVNFIIDGTFFSFGILLLELLDDLQETKSVTSWVGSAQLGMSMMMGPLVSMLLKRFSIRQVAIAGTLLASVGFVASAFAPNIYVLIAMYGVVAGTGFSMIFLPAIIVVGLYFSKKRAIATGIATSGSGLGTFAYAYLCDQLLRIFTWRKTILILCGILLNCLACGLIFRPLIPVTRRKVIRIQSRLSASSSSSSSREGSVVCSDSSLMCSEFEREGEGEVMSKKNSSGGGDDDGGIRTCERLHQSVTGLEEVGKTSQENGGTMSPELFRPQLGHSRHRHHRRHHLHHHPHPHRQERNGVAKRYDSNSYGWGGISTAAPSSLIPAERLYHSVDNFCREVAKPSFSKEEEKLLYFSDTQLHPGPCYKDLDKELEKEHIVQGLLRPILRKDIYYSASVSHLAEFQKCEGSMASFLVRMTQPVSDDSGCSISTTTTTQVGGGRGGQAVRKCVRGMRSVCDGDLFQNKAFLLLLVTFTTWTVQSVVLTYMPNLAVSKGIPKEQAAYLISIVGITNIVGRILAGVFTDTVRVRSVWLYVTALFLAAAVNYAIPWCDSFALLASASAVFGLCMAVAVSMRTIVLAEELGIQVLTQSFGIVACFQGVAFTVNPPIAGKLFDETGDYFWPFTLSGTCYLISALSCLAVGVWFKPHQDTTTLQPTPEIIHISLEEIVSESESCKSVAAVAVANHCCAIEDPATASASVSGSASSLEGRV
ncbi:hypothetical protein ACOMHN_061078 [Nucella lapillus]